MIILTNILNYKILFAKKKNEKKRKEEEEEEKKKKACTGEETLTSRV